MSEKLYKKKLKRNYKQFEQQESNKIVLLRACYIKPLNPAI